MIIVLILLQARLFVSSYDFLFYKGGTHSERIKVICSMHFIHNIKQHWNVIKCYCLRKI